MDDMDLYIMNTICRLVMLKEFNAFGDHNQMV